ncbi:MAG: bacillithiol biosynthesis deacetylase BshB1 [Bacteroidota bacterium]|nr:bacillithiol biosynthesis deacetylase BshB1 [Bacteroidota bacterium]MDX5404416.1 bacillithiol biosynthesis deacetylase BshB1 [Bacteroidota bacterium]MDX5428427.1 bacillithiol biosynthesis deacetylase BshB1 [Bacteroidota bacterium]MDX5447055.1 bacillithiol biosynthesis deacetylase BshB1 [Bacteroidota bacterium]MDX5506194.1 bacillithiol biosynthesis deacetylase BshB1 [Bacteroidota bacterium]
MKLDILAFGAHPDDVELGAAGTLAKHQALGYKTGIVDLTRGEMGTRGSREIRNAEASKAAEILNLTARENLDLRDGFIANDEESQIKVIQVLRKYQPDVILCNAPHDRHPDHGRASELVVRAAFLAGLRRIETFEDGEPQQPWRPRSIYHYIQFYDLEPNLIVDITGYMDQKMESVEAYSSQFYDPNSKEPQTLIAQKDFLDMIRFRAQNFGIHIGVEYGEPFIVERVPGVDDLTQIL